MAHDPATSAAPVNKESGGSQEEWYRTDGVQKSHRIQQAFDLDANGGVQACLAAAATSGAVPGVPAFNDLMMI